MKCPSCGYENKDEDLVCGMCSVPLKKETKAEPAAAEAPSAEGGPPPAEENASAPPPAPKPAGKAVKPEGDWMDKILNTWWGKFVFAAMAGGFGFYLFTKFTQLESGEKESITVPSWVASLYEFGGKWGAVSIFILAALAFIVWGLKQMASGKE